MRITSIEPQQRNPSRRNIYVDGEFALGLSAEALIRAGLRVGDELTAEALTRLEADEELISARAAALRLLAVRPRTVKEIRDRLREKEFGDEEIARTIGDLERASLLNDEEFARMYIRDALTLKPAGKMLLRRKLLLLGVEKDTVTRVLEEGFRDVDLGAEALSVARQFVKRTRNVRKGEDEVRLRKRTAAFLARRGFAWDLIADTLKQLFADDPTSGEDHE